MINKKCNTCLNYLLIEKFSRDKTSKDGLNSKCVNCCKEYHIKNKLHILNRTNKYYQDNKLEHQKRMKNWRENNHEKSKQIIKNWEINNFNKHQDYHREYDKKCINNGYKKNWFKNKYSNDNEFKILTLLRSRISSSLKNNNKSKKTIELLCCKIDEFKIYIESQFLPEMNWNNWGDVWELDHILPCSKFNMEFLEEQQKCFHFTNYQPLFKTTEIAESFGYTNQIGNRNKSNKTIPLTLTKTSN